MTKLKNQPIKAGFFTAEVRVSPGNVKWYTDFNRSVESNEPLIKIISRLMMMMISRFLLKADPNCFFHATVQNVQTFIQPTSARSNDICIETFIQFYYFILSLNIHQKMIWTLTLTFRTISEGNNHDPPHSSSRGRSTWHKPNMVSESPIFLLYW